MVPTLFRMIFSAMLMVAFQDSDTGFPIRYRFDGNIFKNLFHCEWTKTERC